jgi:hypothetical protein
MQEVHMEKDGVCYKEQKEQRAEISDITIIFFQEA